MTAEFWWTALVLGILYGAPGYCVGCVVRSLLRRTRDAR